MNMTKNRIEADEHNENHNSPLTTSKAPVESPAQSWVSNRSPKGGIKDHLKRTISFTRLLKADGHQVRGQGKTNCCLCPFHGERSPSFHVYEDSGWAKCYGCSWSGDIFTYVMDAYQMTFVEAVHYLSEQIHTVRRLKPVLGMRPKLAAKPEELTQTQQNAIKAAAKRLAEDDARCVSIASKRGWRPATIKALAEEGSLGWDEGALAFLYSTGMKSRNWPHKEIIWDFGRGSVWRGDQIKNAKEIFICEGETDCISLIDKGIEEDGSMAVIALPSASTIPGDLSQHVQGRHVTLCMDDDEAGDRATQKLADMLLDVCASVQTFNFKGVA